MSLLFGDKWDTEDTRFSLLLAAVVSIVSDNNVCCKYIYGLCTLMLIATACQLRHAVEEGIR